MRLPQLQPLILYKEGDKACMHAGNVAVQALGQAVR